MAEMLLSEGVGKDFCSLQSFFCQIQTINNRKTILPKQRLFLACRKNLERKRWNLPELQVLWRQRFG
jgi:hypothetical protein